MTFLLTVNILSLHYKYQSQYCPGATRIRGSSVGIVTRLQARRSGVRITVWTAGFYLLATVQTNSCAQTASYLFGIGVIPRW